MRAHILSPLNTLTHIPHAEDRERKKWTWQIFTPPLWACTCTHSRSECGVWYWAEFVFGLCVEETVPPGVGPSELPAGSIFGRISVEGTNLGLFVWNRLVLSETKEHVSSSQGRSTQSPRFFFVVVVVVFPTGGVKICTSPRDTCLTLSKLQTMWHFC